MVRPGEMASPRHGKGALRARVKFLKNDHIWGERVRYRGGRGRDLPYLAVGARERDRPDSLETPPHFAERPALGGLSCGVPTVEL